MLGPTQTSPLVGASCPRIRRKSTDLPAPFGADDADPLAVRAPAPSSAAQHRRPGRGRWPRRSWRRCAARPPSGRRAGPARSCRPILRRSSTGPLDLVHAVDLALLVARLLDVPLVDDDARPELEARHGLLQPLDLLLLRHVVLLLAGQRQFFLHRIGRVVALVERQPPVGQLGDLRHGVVQQVAVVRDDHHRAGEVAHDGFQEGLAGQVEVVVRLVQQQQVGPAEQAARQVGQLALARRSCAGSGSLQLVGAEAEALAASRSPR